MDLFPFPFPFPYSGPKYYKLTSGPEVLFKTCVAMKFVDDDDLCEKTSLLKTAIH